MDLEPVILSGAYTSTVELHLHLEGAFSYAALWDAHISVAVSVVALAAIGVCRIMQKDK